MTGRRLTPSQTIGPFFAGMLLERQVLFEDGDVRIEGHVYDGAGDPVDDALVEIWQPEGFGRCPTDADGAYWFQTRRADFIDVVVFARGLLKHLVTRMDAQPNKLWRFDIHLQGPDETAFFDV